MASLLTDAIASLGRWQAFRSYDGESSAHEWLEDLEETMDKMGYRQSSFVERASEKLQGEAKSWYRWWREYDQPGPLSWEDFKATFLDEFGLSTSDWEERLVTCQQCLQEPTQAYSNRFTTYARRANRMNDPSLVTVYVRGLKKSLSEALDLFGRRTPTSTLKEAMRAAANLSRCNWRALLADEELPPEPAGRRVRFEDSRTTDRPRSPWTRNADVRREEERRYSRPSSNGSSSGSGGGHRGGSSTAPVGGGGGNGGGGNRDRDRNDRNLHCWRQAGRDPGLQAATPPRAHWRAKPTALAASSDGNGASTAPSSGTVTGASAPGGGACARSAWCARGGGTAAA